MKVNVIGEQLSQEEIDAYIEYGRKKYSDRIINGMTVKTDGDFVDLKYDFEPDVPFDRIRRITGYLVGTLDRFNNGKRAEEHDRVKHSATLQDELDEMSRTENSENDLLSQMLA